MTPSDDILSLLKLVAGRLDAAGIPYMVSGSVALHLYGIPRMTRDLDIVIDPSPRDAAALTAAFEADCYVSADAVRDAVQRRGMFNVIHNETIEKVDFVVTKDEPFRREEMARRRSIVLDGADISVVTPEDLVLSKLVWSAGTNSEMQRRDVISVLRLVEPLDVDYLRRWADTLGLRTALDAAVAEAGR